MQKHDIYHKVKTPKVDPLIEYFKNLNPDGFIDNICIDGVPLADAIQYYKNDRIALQLIKDELNKVPLAGEVERLRSRSLSGDSAF